MKLNIRTGFQYLLELVSFFFFFFEKIIFLYEIFIRCKYSLHRDEIWYWLERTGMKVEDTKYQFQT